MYTSFWLLPHKIYTNQWKCAILRSMADPWWVGGVYITMVCWLLLLFLIYPPTMWRIIYLPVRHKITNALIPQQAGRGHSNAQRQPPPPRSCAPRHWAGCVSRKTLVYIYVVLNIVIDSSLQQCFPCSPGHRTGSNNGRFPQEENKRKQKTHTLVITESNRIRVSQTKRKPWHHRTYVSNRCVSYAE